HTSGGFANQTPYTLRPGLFHCLARLPSCVTPVNALDSMVQVLRSSHQHTRKRTDTALVVSTTSSSWTVLHLYVNITPLFIDFACRPRLWPRLTLGTLY